MSESGNDETPLKVHMLTVTNILRSALTPPGDSGGAHLSQRSELLSNANSR
jgi:hypothetical protein